MARKTSSRSRRINTESGRTLVQVRAPAPEVKPDDAAQRSPVVDLHPAASASSASSPTPLDGQSWHEQIARRAYELFLARGGAGGDPFHDWLRAERELLQSRAA